jgi:hypothetical protein
MYRSLYGRCLHCQSSDHSARMCEKIYFKKGSCCVTCGFPQRAFEEEIHGNVTTGECEEGMRDVMKGVCWSVYRTKELKNRWFRKMELKEMNEKEFMKWMTRMDESGEMNNGCRVTLEVWRDRN